LIPGNAKNPMKNIFKFFPLKKTIKFADLCCGIGGFRLGLENACKKSGFKSKCVFSSDIDKDCRNTYSKNFNDIPDRDLLQTDIKSVPQHDILFSGFPCQPFSQAGKRRGLKDKRANVLLKIIDIIKVKKPGVFLLENVPGVMTENSGQTFKKIIIKLQEAGYEVSNRIINGINFVPQDRKRIYILGIYKGKKCSGEILQKIRGYGKRVIVNEKFYKKERVKHIKVYQGYSYTLTSSMENSGHIPYIEDEKGFRKITPRECARLMGIPDNFILPQDDKTAYKQIGNSVIVPLVEEICMELLKVI